MPVARHDSSGGFSRDGIGYIGANNCTDVPIYREHDSASRSRGSPARCLVRCFHTSHRSCTGEASPTSTPLGTPDSLHSIYGTLSCLPFQWRAVRVGFIPGREVQLEQCPPRTHRQDNCRLAKSACRESNPVFRWLTGERSKSSRHGASTRLMRWMLSRPLGGADDCIDECVFPEQVDVIRYVSS